MSFDDAFKKFPHLETDRLVLREITMDDVEQIFRLYNNLEKSHLFLSPRFAGMPDAKKFIEQSHKFYEEKVFIDWWITLGGNSAIVGTIRFGRFEGQSKAVIGYFIASEYRGKGIMTEALKAVVRFAFKTMELHRIEATDHPENHASSRVLEKVGFQKEGLLREHVWRGDHWSDSVIWSILGSDFE